LKLEQIKTKGHSNASSVVIPLNDGLLSLIGQPATENRGNEIIFPLPSHHMCLKALRHWTARAGIEKHITAKFYISPRFALNQKNTFPKYKGNIIF